LAAFVAEHRGDPTVDHPVVIGGDFNALPDSDEIRMLTGRTEPAVPGVVLHDAWELAGNTDPGWTWATTNSYQDQPSWPNRRIDYVLVSWPRPKGVATPVTASLAGRELIDGVQGSDHFAVVVELR
jgi:endonuclease/exonuclease/phosphatase family metal-dependent hydrolase